MKSRARPDVASAITTAPLLNESQGSSEQRQIAARLAALPSPPSGSRRQHVLILLLFTISVFAPFLANGMPYWYFGYNRFEYQEGISHGRHPDRPARKSGKSQSRRTASAKSNAKKFIPATTTEKILTIERNLARCRRNCRQKSNHELAKLSAQRVEELSRKLASDDRSRQCRARC